jgi:hypothetical protein
MGRKRTISFLCLGPRLYLYEFDAVMAALLKKYGTNVA